jgi:hypothetical protein
MRYALSGSTATEVRHIARMRFERRCGAGCGLRLRRTAAGRGRLFAAFHVPLAAGRDMDIITVCIYRQVL